MAIKKKFPYKSAVVACNGGCNANQEEPKCSYGCVGCGACVDACKFGAISINSNGVAEVDEEKCIACGMCVRACAQNIIHIHECANYIVVKCSNHDKGAEARKECEVSCIGCGICEKTCTAGAIKVEDNCAVIDYEKCLSCGLCSVKCPHHAIYDLRGIFTSKN
ncbi:MAG: 4Fe-4S binding protein [Oscillospiraceae bacterium]